MASEVKTQDNKIYIQMSKTNINGFICKNEY